MHPVHTIVMHRAPTRAVTPGVPGTRPASWPREDRARAAPPPRSSRLPALLAALVLWSLWGPALAWWDEAWGQRTRFTIDTSAQGVAVSESLVEVAVPLRLHSGNFDFGTVQPDGRDIRVLAADDKTPLPMRIERFDLANELAVVWVRVPQVLPGSAANAVYVYSGNPGAPPAAAQPPADVFTASTLLAVLFDDAGGEGADARGNLRAAAAVTPETNALLGGGARLAGAPVRWAGEALRRDAGAASTFSLWLRPDAAATGTLLQWGELRVVLQDGQVQAKVAGAALAGGALAGGRWAQVAVVLSGSQARLVVDGAEVAQAAVAAPALPTELAVGEGFNGAVDQLEVAGLARSNAWLLAAHAAQGSEGRLLQSTLEDAQAAGGGGQPGYMGILIKNLTVDAWVVIVILGLMFVQAAWIMVARLRYIAQVDSGNRSFLERFRGARADLLELEREAAQHGQSSLYRLYAAGVRELKKRDVGQAGAAPLSGASLDAVKASVDADLVRESHRLNAQMVWLTIAISGGPFLGLLGTVVGVMITFAAIAAAGDVNVNAIAPGIAAALLATVAGLAVAIPALFGYNYLASRIKNISADMQIFVDEFITRVAEQYGAR